METPSLELRPLGRETKSLKHKHKSKPKSSQKQQKRGGRSDPTVELVSRDDQLRELLAGKIAEIQVGGDETFDDLSGR